MQIIRFLLIILMVSPILLYAPPPKKSAAAVKAMRKKKKMIKKAAIAAPKKKPKKERFPKPRRTRHCKPPCKIKPAPQKKVKKPVVKRKAAVTVAKPKGAPKIRIKKKPVTRTVGKKVVNKDNELMKAAHAFNVDKIREWLNKGANINVHDSNGNTPLMLAADQGYDDIVTLLVDSGASLSQKNNAGKTALDLATWRPIKEYLANFELWRGAAAGDTARLQRAIEAGADINAISPRDATALMIAVNAHSLPAVQFLLGAAADQTIGTNGVTPLMYAQQKGYKEIVDAFEAVKPSVAPIAQPAGPHNPEATAGLFNAIENRSLEDVDAALHAGADINAIDATGYTPLMNALNLREEDIVDRLLALHPRVDIRSQRRGDSALLLAVFANKPNWITAILDLGANINEQDADGDTALMLAAREGFIEIAKVLIARGANPAIRNRAGQTAGDIANAAARKLAVPAAAPKKGKKAKKKA